ncbi:hypothetical protein ACSBM8_13950 [Sphingomonas sp. ASY06-1R]|uniref:hypothetical protein n=1 Tax=Sphingomonas sp. ASY06-1R TaxID=3445771 RepID=UPI003FA1F9D9
MNSIELAVLVSRLKIAAGQYRLGIVGVRVEITIVVIADTALGVVARIRILAIGAAQIEFERIGLVAKREIAAVAFFLIVVEIIFQLIERQAALQRAPVADRAFAAERGAVAPRLDRLAGTATAIIIGRRIDAELVAIAELARDLDLAGAAAGRKIELGG